MVRYGWELVCWAILVELWCRCSRNFGKVRLELDHYRLVAWHSSTESLAWVRALRSSTRMKVFSSTANLLSRDMYLYRTTQRSKPRLTPTAHSIILEPSTPRHRNTIERILWYMQTRLPITRKQTLIQRFKEMQQTNCACSQIERNCAWGQPRG